MKAFLTFIALVQICIPLAHAQLLKGYGFKTGIAVASQYFDYAAGFDLEYDNRIGFDFGGFVEWFDFYSFSVLTEARYIQKGMTYELQCRDEYNLPTGTEEVDNRLDYLSVSLLVKWVLKYKPISPYLIAGPRFDFLLGYKSKYYSELYEEFEPIDVGGDIGIGGEFKFGQFPTILSEFRYNFYFTDAYKTNLLQVENRSFEILAGLRLW